MISDSQKSFVTLKYSILSRDTDTWYLAESYPGEVRERWAWRCALDAEYLAINCPIAQHCIHAAKLYKGRYILRDQLSAAATQMKTLKSLDSIDACNAGYAFYYASYYDVKSIDYAKYAVYTAFYASTYSPTHHSIFSKYVDWLVEELCIWEYEQEHLNKES